MKWIRNLKITQKFILLLVVTLLSLLVVGSLGFTQLISTGKKLDDMYVNKLKPIETVTSLKTNTQYIQTALVELMVNTDQARNQELLSKMEEIVKDNQQHRKSYQTDNPDELKLLNSITELASQYKETQDKIIDYAMKNQNTEAYEVNHLIMLLHHLNN
ncbi:MCP four helix bundle domain-containing protein [Ferdinandcohnia quinoae]|uniref:MCP four helix bundle domain-containing protein n=1 Tax=Fredinandcohnia quinoae TaxID=2918902 RepID=A0AAW5DXV5_9BACI|nr:MCP four helix bundle domain-containing protein [Fredinandcohnia sp. SECRCQ15]MCH1624134.1 MCP four helix bundle domain-containing protein [Fredinandcohnia sp. SECRCQ15]